MQLVFETDFGIVARLTLRQRGTGFWNCIDCIAGQLNLEACDISSQSLTCISIHKKVRSTSPMQKTTCPKCGEIFRRLLVTIRLAWQEARPRIWRNRIHDCGGTGIYIYDSATASVRSIDSPCYHPRGIDIPSKQIEDNEVHNNGQSGIEISEGANPEVGAYVSA